MKNYDYQGRKDLQCFVKNCTPKNYKLSEQEQQKTSLIIMGEHDEVANSLVTQKIGETLRKQTGRGAIDEIHITDLHVYNMYDLYLRALINVPSNPKDIDAFDNVTECIKMIIQLVDRAATLLHSPAVKTHCEKARKEKRKKDKEREQQLKEDLAKEAETEKMKKMTPEEQQKYKMKLEKRDASRQQRGKIMKIAK